MTFTYCHNCGDAHDDWTPGDVWTCRRCGFTIPVRHLWQWCQVPEDAPKQIVQLSFLEDA